MRRYILTGGTGFLGSLLGEELLRHGHEVIFLGRSKGEGSYDERQKTILLAINKDVPLIHSRYYEVDLEKTFFGLDEGALVNLTRCDGFFHLAADLSFRDANRSRVFAANRHSLERLTELLEKLCIPLFYTSTAYVHGEQPRGKVMREEICQRPKVFHNPYEESKYEAESYIHAWGEKTDMPYCIFRPSIIIDREGKTSTPYGFYAFLIGLLKLKVSLGAQIESTLKLPVPFPYAKDGRLNLVPADLVIRWMIRIAESDKYRNKTFHLVTVKPFPIERIIEEAFEGGAGLYLWSFQAPDWLINMWVHFISIIGIFNPAFRSLSERIRLFQYYMTGDVLYDTANTLEVTGDDIETLSIVPEGYLTEVTKHFIRHYRKRKESQ